MNVDFREFNDIYLEYSWKWLNDPEIKMLTNSKEITKKEQMEWFCSLPARKDYLIWGIEANSNPIGACGLKNLESDDCEYWGYIGEKQYWGIGIGLNMMLFLEEKAIELGKSSIWLKVTTENIRAISLYKKLGYAIESEANSLLVMRKSL